VSLEYVHRNVAAGRTPFGRWIDRVYLDTVGWRGIRQRNKHVALFLREAMERLRRQGLSARVLDIAAGTGRYVLDAVNGAPAPDAIELRDYRAENVGAGRALIRERGLERIATFIQSDAFDRGPETKNPRFTIGVVSGFYELYSDNPAVSDSLARLAATIEEGGYLIYTGQPWHPQLELIARVLTSHRGGRPWIMRRRTQAELDQLVAAVGFTKIAQRIDDGGLFTGSRAERTARAAGSRDCAPLRLATR
jgi:hypothetical protein